ncbi:SLAM family member 7-like [Salarias fasciatus]|uniref:SLAM family member 7-like n=1 Tax=Salarias fasciatus TaxID=181472 RepID=UPI00117676C4|nr:SLAM family member 7-like [Salarias fasciatus]
MAALVHQEVGTSTLRASVGRSVTLPDTVKEEGFLLYGGKILAQVDEKKLFKIYGDNYKERLHWNQNTGRFTLTRLQKYDSGIYAVDSKKGRVVFVDYKLIVYDSVQTPNVSILNRSSESCSLSCSVDSAQEDTTLLWSKDQEILKKKRSAASLSLTLFYWQDLDSPLQCVAENSAENKTVSVEVRTVCPLKQRGNPNSSTDSRHHLILIILIPMVCSIIFILCVSAVWRFSRQQDSSAGQTENNLQEPSEYGNPILTSVCYKPAFNSLQNMNLQLKTEKHRQS